jgi:hypothetical protein
MSLNKVSVYILRFPQDEAPTFWRLVEVMRQPVVDGRMLKKREREAISKCAVGV